jgi:AcrR family transcriptional regulator
MLAATFDVVAERGAANVTVAHIVERSGVSRRTFYKQFEDRDDCLLAAFEHALTIARGDVLPAYDAAESWPGSVRAGLIALLAFCDREPSIARLLICESQASGPRLSKRYREVVAQLIRTVDEGRTLTGTRKAARAENVSPLVAEGIVAGVLAVIQVRLMDPKHGTLLGLTNELMSMIVLPYLGGAAARRELERPRPASVSPRREDVLISDPFKGAGMRLTYRTVRALMAIAQHPDGSNRVIGETAGVTDQGQISKLLGRLERIALVSNAGSGPGTGTPNSWTLTEKGERIVQNIRTNTEANQSHAGSNNG